MPQIITFGNRTSIEPGSMSRVLGSFPQVPLVGASGNVCIIDTGTGSAGGYGSGINGANVQGQNAVYTFTNSTDSKSALRMGILYDLMDYLWSPSTRANGIQKLYYIRACTTTAPEFAFDFVDSSYSPLSAGGVTIDCITEGLSANGAINSGSILTRGYGVKLKSGIIDNTKFILEFYEGRYRGADANGIEYDVAENSITQNTVVARSIEFANVNQLIAWMGTDPFFLQYFKLKTSTASALTMGSQNLITYSTTKLFVGGTTNYNATDVDAALNAIPDLDNSMFISVDYGVTPTLTGGQKLAGANQGALSVANNKILSYMLNASTYENKIMFMGGGQNSTQYQNGVDGSMDIAQYYNTSYACAVHSASKIVAAPSNSGLTYRYVDSIYTAAMVCGRIAGLAPQVPGTYKDIRVIGLLHVLSKSQREQALLAGLCHIRQVPLKGWVINQSITTLSPNAQTIYNDGSTPEISIQRIFYALNYMMQVNAAVIFVGGNLNTSSSEDVRVFTDSELSSVVATPLADNLILTYNNIKVVLKDDKYFVTYCLVANGPVNRLFETGYALDPSTFVNSNNQ